MDVSKPFESILPGVDSAVIRSLAQSSIPRTGRDIARSSERSHTAVQKVLTRLVGQGVVLEEPAGRARVYRLNRDHLVASAFESLASLRSQLFERMRLAFESWEIPPVHASVFGSAARGDGTSGSDIDIFVVRSADISWEDDDWRKQVHGLSDDIYSWTGNHAGISEMDVRNLIPMKAGEVPIAKDISEDGIHLFGVKIKMILGGRLDE